MVLVSGGEEGRQGKEEGEQEERFEKEGIKEKEEVICEDLPLLNIPLMLMPSLSRE
eukprot:m.439461 g.439461  ORF g.439461 m.439461 type:complete len:56 (-) comp18393_c0_seq1:109-276(-)